MINNAHYDGNKNELHDGPAYCCDKCSVHPKQDRKNVISFLISEEQFKAFKIVLEREK